MGGFFLHFHLLLISDSSLNFELVFSDVLHPGTFVVDPFVTVLTQVLLTVHTVDHRESFFAFLTDVNSLMAEGL